MKTLNKDELNKIPDLRESDLSSMPLTVEFLTAGALENCEIIAEGLGEQFPSHG